VYKLLLCVRYLQTRYLAFICIVSVMLGVATLIVVNAVMSGFSTKLKDRLHGVLSDVVIDTDRPDGFYVPDEATGRPLTPDEIIERIKHSSVGPRIEAITPTIEVFAILQFEYRGQTFTKPIRLIGVDPQGRAEVGGFSQYLVRQHDSPAPSFDLPPQALQQHEKNRRDHERANALDIPVTPKPKSNVPGLNDIPEPDEGAMKEGMVQPKLYGVIPGFTLAHFRFRDANGEVVEEEALRLGDPVTIFTAGATPSGDGMRMRPVWGSFLVTDYLKTEMSEYDQSFVYVPIEHLQRLRTMEGRCTAFQIKLRNYEEDKGPVTEVLQGMFPPHTGSRVATWEEHQGSLLAAIDVEKGILNLLLFMIVGVAGFSILAIFTMIVSEKYRDIGILKSLGASHRGVMSIFVGYGLLLGTVGCALGTGLGLWITYKINDIEQWLTTVTGKQVFPRDVYYFKDIPTNVDVMSVVSVNVGAVAIAVLFSLLPAWRAARLHPVRALRFE
jgi:lipoprotein-releasing system permease protein